MIRQVTIDKLHEMRLSAMASAFENQCADAATYQDLSFEDRFGMLVDREWEKRKKLETSKAYPQCRIPVSECQCRSN